MNKLSNIFLFLIAFIFFSTAQAIPNDICSQLPGFWKGVSHIKTFDATLCSLTGCTRLFMASAERVTESKYHVKLTYPSFTNEGAKIQKQEFDLTCENGNITLPVAFKYTIETSCDLTNHCLIAFDGNGFNAELIKA